MIERGINVATVKLTSKAHATNVAPSSATASDSPNKQTTVSSADIASIREYVRFALECIGDVLQTEERYGNRKPIIRTLRRYRDDATALLARIT